MPLRTPSRRAPVAVLVGSLVATLAVAWGFDRAHLARDRARFEYAADDAVDALRDRIGGYLALLHTMRALFDSNPQLDRDGFRRYTESLRLAERYPGLQGLGFAESIPRAAIPSVEARMRAEGAEGFHVWPEGNGAEVGAAEYVEPLDDVKRRLIGFDLLSEPSRASAMLRARDTGEASATYRISVLKQVDPAQPPGFVIYLPVYRGAPRTVEERHQALRGWVYCGFRTAGFFRSIFRVSSHPYLAVTVLDRNPETADALLYRSDVSGDPPGYRPSFTVDRALPVAGRTWTLELASRPAFDALSSRRQVAIVLLFGVLFSLALGGVMQTQVAARSAAESSASRLRLLSAATARLGTTLDYAATLREVASLPVPSFADGCSIDLLDAGSNLEQVAIHHRDPDQLLLLEERRRRFPQAADAPHGPAAVARTGKSELLEHVGTSQVAAASRSPEQAALLERLDVGSVLSVPLRGHQRVLGTLTFVLGRAERHYSPADVAFAEELASRAAAALENARLHADARAAESEAEAQRARLYSLFMQAPVAIAIQEGPEHVYQLANSWYRQFLGNRELVGRPRKEVLPDFARLARILDEVYASGQPFDGREQIFKVDRGDGQWVEGYFNLICQPWDGADGARRGVITFGFEVTDLVRARKDKEALASDLEAAVRARDTFLAVASHELRTPLTTLQLQTDGLMRSLERQGPAPLDVERARYRVQKIQQQALRLNRLIGDLLDVSRITAGRLTIERERFDLMPLVEDALQRTEEALARAGCTVELRAEAVTGNWDRLRIDQVVINLLTNAAKYGAGKPITVTVGPSGQSGEAARIEVRDQGIGIAPEDQARIFERFERAVSERNFGGLGLGLWISKQIVSAHGGTIRVESQPSLGSTFTVELPRSE